MLYRIVNHLVAISPQLYLIPRGVALKVIVVVYTIKTGISNIWQLSGGGLLILPRWRQLRQQLVIRSIDGLLMKKKIVGDFVSSSKVVGTWCRVL
jgi:hypothetical protein